MFRVPDYYRYVSRKLSQVMDDLGINPRLVNVRRESLLLTETLVTLTNNVVGEDLALWFFGSQIEGTTTLGLNSDTDILFYPTRAETNVITEWGDWMKGKRNFLMIQDEKTQPGYCRLQVLNNDVPVSLENIPESRENKWVQHFEYDDLRRVLLKNTFGKGWAFGSVVINGPAVTYSEHNLDHVLGLSIRSKFAVQGIQWRQEYSHVIRTALEEECFVVPTGHKNSPDEPLEWRISTSVAERLMMFSMNITQLRCYVLLKIIVKSFITQIYPDTISSYHCKTILMHFVENVPNDFWCEENLLLCVTVCLQFLFNCIISNTCFHYFIPRNNLFEGRINRRTRRNIALLLKQILDRNGDFLLELRIDDIGQRLRDKLCSVVPNSIQYVTNVLSLNNEVFILYTRLFHLMLLQLVKIGQLCNRDERALNEAFQTLMLYAEGGSVQRRAIELILPSLSTTMATCLASNCIRDGSQLSTRALSFFGMGIDSDVSSGRLKLASALLCSGNIDKTELVLRNIEDRYNTDIVKSLGISGDTQQQDYRLPFNIIGNENINSLRSHLAFEVMFTRGELYCVPPGLAYEMIRCTEEEIAERNSHADNWMDNAVVDSLPYLYYLQYLTYGRLGRQPEQQRALNSLISTIRDELQLYHRETALNLLGQCMVHEGRLMDALTCYRLSLNERPTHNVARLHIANVLTTLNNNT